MGLISLWPSGCDWQSHFGRISVVIPLPVRTYRVLSIRTMFRL